MFRFRRAHIAVLLAVGWFGCAYDPAVAAVRIDGQVQAGGGPVAQSAVTLWAATASAPPRLARTQTGVDGGFAISVDQAVSDDAILYLVATGGTPSVNKAGGDNPAIALLAVLGSNPPAHVVVNEFTTLASVVTTTQFLDSTVIKGQPLHSESPPATCPTSSISQPAATARPSRTD